MPANEAERLLDGPWMASLQSGWPDPFRHLWWRFRGHPAGGDGLGAAAPSAGHGSPGVLDVPDRHRTGGAAGGRGTSTTVPR